MNSLDKTESTIFAFICVFFAFKSSLPLRMFDPVLYYRPDTCDIYRWDISTTPQYHDV